MNVNQIPHIWDAAVYYSNSSIQFQAAIKLLSTLEISSCKKIIDLGCGDGKITAWISRHLPEALIVGMDASSQMIDFACRMFSKQRNLEFHIQDINDLNYSKKYDFICSFFALQWISNLTGVLGKIYESLVPGGIAAFIIPLNISPKLDRAIQKMISLPEWSEYFEAFSPGWYFRDSKEIQDFLTANSFLSQRFEIVLQEMSFGSRADLEKFILPWLTHLDRVPEPLEDLFFRRLIDLYLELEQPLQDGSISYKYSLIEVVSKKLVK